VYRKVTKARGHFPSDHAAVKLLWLAIINIEDKRTRERADRRQQAGNAQTSPLASSRASASWAGARPQRTQPD
jgi:transposase-like protein